MLVGASCTAELIQDDPGGLAKALSLPIPVVPIELPAYQRKENWGASETFYQLVRHLAAPTQAAPAEQAPRSEGRRPRCNLLGPTALGFRHRDDVTEVTKLLDQLGIDVQVVAPLDATPADLRRLGEADFNIVLYPEVADLTARWLERSFGQPAVRTVPIGVGATRDFIREVAAVAGVDADPVLAGEACRLPWYSRSVDSTYLTGKRVFIFGDATHAIAAARIASEEFGFTVVGLGTYAREQARDVREAARKLGLEALISDDYLEVEETIAALQPELVLGSQMERHIAKRLGIPCAVISAPVHVQDFPARYSPQMGFEGANVIFDSWVHPLMMGLEEHLLGMFREDFEFADGASPSHLGHAVKAEASAAGERAEPLAEAPAVDPETSEPTWAREAEIELKKIPFFVRGKARVNTERFAADRGLHTITVETLCQSALRSIRRRRCASLSSRWTAIWPRRPSGRGRSCGGCFRAWSSAFMPPPSGTRMPMPCGAVARTSPAATSSSRPCCSWRTTSRRCCRPCRHAAMTATPWWPACRPVRSSA